MNELPQLGLRSAPLLSRHAPALFAVGQYYTDFRSTSENEVRALL